MTAFLFYPQLFYYGSFFSSHLMFSPPFVTPLIFFSVMLLPLLFCCLPLLFHHFPLLFHYLPLLFHNFPLLFQYGRRRKLRNSIGFFCSSLKARNDFIRTLHRTMHEKYDTVRRVSASGQPGHTVQSPRCAQHQQLKLSNAAPPVETGIKLRSGFINPLV